MYPYLIYLLPHPPIFLARLWLCVMVIYSSFWIKYKNTLPFYICFYQAIPSCLEILYSFTRWYQPGTIENMMILQHCKSRPTGITEPNQNKLEWEQCFLDRFMGWPGQTGRRGQANPLICDDACVLTSSVHLKKEQDPCHSLLHCFL